MGTHNLQAAVERAVSDEDPRPSKTGLGWGNFSRNPADSLQLFRLLREASLGMFEKFTEKPWECHGVHGERGDMSVRDLGAADSRS